jgi:fatty-acyl-CoA synthase
MYATTAKQVHELFVERFNAQDADGVLELYEPNAVILPPGAPEAVSGHAAIRAVLDGILALKGKMDNTIVRVIERQDIAILYSRWTVTGTGPNGTPVTLGGQIPAMYNMEWRTAGYDARDLSSVQLAVYGGQSAPLPFLEQMLRVAPKIATGLGLTEASGFCTYTEMSPDASGASRGVGWAMPAYRVSVRAPMAANGEAGAELADGETGHVCFHGPQNFLGYLNDPAATAAALSTDGWLYTGDLGQITGHGLRLAGRARWVLKPAGNQVFPGDIEEHFAALTDLVANVAAVGQPHSRWSEGIIAFVEKRAGAALDEALLRRHARALTSYMRPLHYVIVEPGGLPLNRAAKVDLLELQRRAAAEVAALRARGRWE